MKVKAFIYNILRIFLISSLSLTFVDADPVDDSEDLDTDETSIESASSKGVSSLHKSNFTLKSWQLFSEKIGATNHIAGVEEITVPTFLNFLIIGFHSIPKKWNILVDLFLLENEFHTYFRRGPPSIAY